MIQILFQLFKFDVLNICYSRVEMNIFLNLLFVKA